MINSETPPPSSGPSQDEMIDAIVRSGARGGLTLAGIATAIVIGLWFVFYLFVFMPRVPSQ